MFQPELLARIQKTGIIAVLTIDEAVDAAPAAKALLAGGIDVMELALRTPGSLEAIRMIKREVPEMVVGAGTVLTPGQVDRVCEAGAAFGVAPGLNERVIQRASSAGLSFAPGIATPSEIERGLELGLRVFKFFPAEPLGGLPYLKSMAAPYAHLHLRYIPLGGINEDNLLSYLQEPAVAAIGGSWIAPRAAIRKRDTATITENARRAVSLRS